MDYYQQIFSFKNRHVVITGGAGVIAQSLATGYLRCDAVVSLWGRTLSTLEEAKKEILRDQKILAENIRLEVVDCSDKKSLQKAWKNSNEQYGMPHVLINCVGGNKGKSTFLEQDEVVFREILELNLLAGLLLPSQVFAKKWQENKIEANIINFASMTSYQCFSGVWAYDAAKAGVFNLTRGMAKEFAPFGIRVNSISPGFFIGKQNKALLVKNDDPYELTERGKLVIEKTPMGRFGNHKDLQGAALFLASNEAAGFVTGIDIPVDGGFLVDSI